MKTKLGILLGVLLLTTFTLQAQNQREKFKEWGNVELTELTGVEVGPATVKYQLTLNNWEDPYMWNAEFNNRKFYAVPEQQAHPTFLTNGTDWGDEEMKYFLNFTSQGGGYYNKSILIIGDLLYFIEELQDHSWKVEEIYTKEAFKGVKGMLKLDKKRKELAKIDHDKIVNDYLKKEKEVLDTKTPAYKEKHKDYFERFKLEKGWANSDIEKSYEILHDQRVKNVVRIKNNKSTTVYIGFKGAGSVPNDEIKPGSEVTVECNLADIWLLTGENGTPVKVLFTPSEWCGKKFMIE